MSTAQMVMSPSNSLPFSNMYARLISNLNDELENSEHSSCNGSSSPFRSSSDRLNAKQFKSMNRNEKLQDEYDQSSQPSSSSTIIDDSSSCTGMPAGTKQHRRSSFSATSQQPRANIRKNVSFDNIAIRHYNVTLGKHLCEHDFGPSVTLDWSYEDESRLALNDYENHRLTKRRSRDNLVPMARTEREQRLQAVGFDISKINKVASRRRSISNERRHQMESLGVIYSSSNLVQQEQEQQEQEQNGDEPLEF